MGFLFFSWIFLVVGQPSDGFVVFKVESRFLFFLFLLFSLEVGLSPSSFFGCLWLSFRTFF